MNFSIIIYISSTCSLITKSTKVTLFNVNFLTVKIVKRKNVSQNHIQNCYPIFQKIIKKFQIILNDSLEMLLIIYKFNFIYLKKYTF